MSNQQGSLLFFGENTYHKMISSNETRFALAISDLKISDLIISEGLSFNISQK